MKIDQLTENMSYTAKRIHDIEKEKGVTPGTPEWFELWFSLPYLKESIDERELTKAEIKKRDDYADDLPDAEFKKRYGKDWEAVKYGTATNMAKGESIQEGYKLQLERDADMYVLHITDTETGKRTEVRGKGGYESGNYDADDKLHQLLDRIGKASNISDLINGEIVGINPKHPDGKSAKKHADVAFNEDIIPSTNKPGTIGQMINWGNKNQPEKPKSNIQIARRKQPDPQSWWQQMLAKGKNLFDDVSVPENIFHMKNRLLKVKKITDAMGNRPIMFRSFVYDAEPVVKVIKKVTNNAGRNVKTGRNEQQSEVLQKLGIENPTFATMAAGRYANINISSLEEDEVFGLQNIFIPLSNEIYYSPAIEDLGLGRLTGGSNMKFSDNFDVDKAVATYKKGWPPAGFDNEIIVDTNEYYLVDLRSFLLELTSPEIKDQIKRLKKEYDKSYSSKASENQVNDILKDLFKTKITTYGDISRWIESVAIPFVNMLGASSVQENFADGKEKVQPTNEAFDNPYPITWEYLKPTGASSAIGKVEDGSALDIHISEDPDGIYEIEFARGQSQKNMGRTGQGDEFRIFATVQTAMIEWWKQLDKTSAKKITFYANKEDGNRARLYKRFLTMWGDKSEWDIEVNGNVKPGLVAYSLTNPNPDEPKNDRKTFMQRIFGKKETVENFKDGKVKGKSRPGRVKRAGASCDGSVTELRKKAKNASGEKAKMYHWCANMKSGRKK